MPGKPASSKESIFLIGLGLLTIVLVAFGISRGLGKKIDGQELLHERFAFTELPFDLEVADAHALGTGDRLVRLERQAEVAGADAAPETRPDRVVLIFHKNDVAPGLLFPPQGQSVSPESLAKWQADATETFKGEITRGRVDFGPWSTPYIRERLFRDTGHWVDSMRVNLSNSVVNCVLFAEFPIEVDGTEERLVELLEGLKLK